MGRERPDPSSPVLTDCLRLGGQLRERTLRGGVSLPVLEDLPKGVCNRLSLL